MKKLLENENALPFEAQRHCKLSLADIEDYCRSELMNGKTSRSIGFLAI